MYRIFFALLISGFLFIHTPAATARELNSSDFQHAQNAFLFVDRGGWNDALLHARRAKNPLVHKTVQWLYYREKDSGATFDEIANFIAQNPHWPNQNTLFQRAEEAMTTYPPSSAKVTQWFERHPPVTGKGKILQVQVSGSRMPTETQMKLVREAWVDGDFDENQEDYIRERYREWLRPQDFADRTSRLLWEERTSAAKRVMTSAPADYQAVFNARMALQSDNKSASALVDKVPASLRNEPGLVFDRMMWRERKGMTGGVDEMLRNAPENVPYPHKWWKLRDKHIRTAIVERRYKDVGALIRNHGQHSGKELAEALWLYGWYQLEFNNQPREAYSNFYALYNASQFPVSKARGAYWAGVAAKRNNNKDIATNWFKQAAVYPTTFYGQMAILELTPHTPLMLPAEHAPTKAEQQEFAKRELVRAVYMLDELKESKLTNDLILHLIDTAKTAADYALTAELGMRMDKPQHGVRAAKRALQKGYVLKENGYPRTPVPAAAYVLEKPLVYSIMRQESEFDRFARSRSNALGMMQLLPSTAKEVSNRLRLPFSPTKLFDPDYNIQLGSTYLRRMVDGFDGSYIQAIAAYNGGPGRVRQWRQAFGPPPKTVEGAVHWIETIPYEETRTYVQRVLENLQVYRYLESNGQAQLQLHKDLVR